MATFPRILTAADVDLQRDDLLTDCFGVTRRVVSVWDHRPGRIGVLFTDGRVRYLDPAELVDDAAA